ncbi:cell wall-binding repeat-containing protein [Desulfosporosinus fructosivorans]|uniref:Cell wall-binding repeat-containing protein n=1 Tax=Desulfosporosinus fructosivorans TaxID=2018669 RepID=A0A4Z0RB73_9FIRM|nr:cell wall-binding repeat-containing protein [Desulfosporosinus fructosivorans]TGE39694.1 cell wall-binding repeat-containing protein [Desulfosporosinus fructosivorans]
MKSKTKLIWTALVLTALLVLPGCSQNQQVIFDAGMKMQDVNSLQQHTTMTFQLSGSDFEPEVQQQINTAAIFLNNAKLDLNSKISSNQEKTVSKAQVDMSLALQGMTIDVPMWVDSDLTGNTPKVIEILRLPQIAQATLPPQFASKEYMVMDPSEMTDSELSSIDMLKLTEFSRNFQETEIAFLNSYAKRFNPKIDVVSVGSQTVQTNDGPETAKIYKLKLNDAQFKDLIRYTVNNFTQDAEAMDFVKKFMYSILEISEVPDKANALSEFDKAFEDFEANKSQFLAEFNTIMDKLDAVTFLGDKGIELKYAISNGYCIQESGTVNLKVNIAQINKFVNTLSEEQQNTPVEAKGTLDLLINFKTDNSGINSPLEITIPEVNSNNSFNYMDLMKTLTVLEPNGKARLSGQDRFQTAKTIGEDFNSGKCTSIILASGNNFPDALSSSILSKKFDAPVLLVGETVEQSLDALSYIAAHSNPDTKIYIIGGTGVIGTSLETELIKGGHVNIERLSGYDRYDTAMAVVDKANVQIGTPVLVASGENFPDALAVSSFSGANQYPTLLVGQNYLSDKTKTYLANSKPTTVYIVGGVFVVSQAVEDQIKELVPTAVIKRLAGNDRFDTVATVINEFSASPTTVFLANGFNFPDALAGSALAAKTGDPVLLIDTNSGTLPPAVEAYLKKLRDAGIRPMVRALGGTAVVPDTLIKQAENLLDGPTIIIGK